MVAKKRSKREPASSLSMGAQDVAGAPATAADEQRILTEAIVATVRHPLIVLDADLRVQLANGAFYQTFHVTFEQTVNHPLYELGNGQWNIPSLRTLLEEVLPKNNFLTDFEVEHAFENLGIRTMVLNARTLAREGNRRSLILLCIEDITERKRAERALRDARDYAEKIIETVREPLLVLDPSLRVRSANESFYRTFQVIPSETQGRYLYDLADRQWDIPRLRDLLENILLHGNAFSDFEVEHHFKQLGHRTMLLNARRVDDVHMILLAIEDITERKQAEEATRRLAAIVDSTEDAVIGETLEGTVTSWNAGAEKLYGYSATEMLGKPLSLLAPPDLADEMPGILERIKQGQRVDHFITRRVRKGGRRIDVAVSVSPIKDAAGQVVGAAAIARDIAESMKMSEALRLQGEIAANMAEGVCLVRARDAAVVYTNEKFDAKFGYRPGELIGRPVSTLNADNEKNPEEFAGEIITALNSHGLWSGQVHNVKRDGTLFWCQANVSNFEHPEHGTVWVSVQTDITERKQAEESLRSSRERISAIVNTADDAILTIDERGIIESANPATERIFGYHATELIGQNVNMLMASPYREEHDVYLAKYRKTGEKKIIGTRREVQGRRKDGSTFPLELAVSEFQVGGQRHFAGVHRDIGQRKALEREVIEIAAEEQRRIGQDLHDSIGQELTGLGLTSEALAEALREQDSPDAGL
ncbi:MAG TPA: PAS domain S-box protein, partial [Isosphaeraceae bacterium]|nr:PAS domain S-box protein [Isosphaeraceae bacterium]